MGYKRGLSHAGRMKTAINKAAAVRRNRATEACFGPMDGDTGSGETAGQEV